MRTTISEITFGDEILCMEDFATKDEVLGIIDNITVISDEDIDSIIN